MSCVRGPAWAGVGRGPEAGNPSRGIGEKVPDYLKVN